MAAAYMKMHVHEYALLILAMWHVTVMGVFEAVICVKWQLLIKHISYQSMMSKHTYESAITLIITNCESLSELVMINTHEYKHNYSVTHEITLHPFSIST